MTTYAKPLVPDRPLARYAVDVELAVSTMPAGMRIELVANMSGAIYDVGTMIEVYFDDPSGIPDAIKEAIRLIAEENQDDA